MAKYYMKYGKGKKEFEFPAENVLGVIKPNEINIPNLSQEDIIKEAFENPIASARLREIVKAGDKVCVVIPDITRAWQSPHIYVPLIIDELNKGGIKDDDILLVSATGSHRFQTEEEFKKLVTEDIYKRIKIIDHDCKDEENLVYVGETMRGTPVKLNKKAMECDHLILAGGVIYHFLAGFGGGRKYILPGISGFETIMKNHSYSLNEGLGSGSNPNVKSGNISESNPVHCDMLEAASFARPSFILNVVVNSEKRITHAFAGNYIKAHEAGTQIVESVDGVDICQKAEMVIASACGYPKDINLYQTSKTIFNAVEALKEKGVMIIVSECSEGFGNTSTENMMLNFDNMLDREKNIREEYSIGKGIAYLECEIAEKYHFILVSDIEQKLLNKTKVKVVKTVQEAIDLAYKIKGKKDLKTYMMPYGANTFPKMR